MKRDGDKVYLSRSEATLKTIYLLEKAPQNIDYEKSKPAELSPVYLACIDKIMNEIAISLAVIADEITEERKRNLGIVSPSEEMKKREEEVRKYFGKGLEEGEK